jgi:hypothetical protein
MARIDAQMTAVGNEPTPCECCEHKFARGEQMSAVVSHSGEPLGWYCDECIRTWNDEAKGV